MLRDEGEGGGIREGHGEEGDVVSVLQGLIDASEDRFKKATQFGQGLITSSHFASEEVKEKVGEPGRPVTTPTTRSCKHHIAAVSPRTLSVCLSAAGGSGDREE